MDAPRKIDDKANNLCDVAIGIVAANAYFLSMAVRRGKRCSFSRFIGRGTPEKGSLGKEQSETAAASLSLVASSE